jgi:hypothetical protein
MEQEIMLTTESIERTLGLYDGGATDSAVAEATGICPAEAKPSPMHSTWARRRDCFAR